MNDEFSSDSYKQEFITRLRNFRNARNISAREMSLSLGQNVNYINLIENGKRLPSMQGFFSICEYLDLAPHDFFKVTLQNQPDSEGEKTKNADLKELLFDMEKLGETEITIIRKMIHALV